MSLYTDISRYDGTFTDSSINTVHTVAVWFRTDTTNTYGTGRGGVIFRFCPFNTQSARATSIEVDNAGTVTANITGTLGEAAMTAPYTDDTWQCAVVRVDGPTPDHRLNTSGGSDTSIFDHGNMGDGTTSVAMGARQANNPSGSSGYDGFLGYAAIWDEYLTDLQVTGLIAGDDPATVGTPDVVWPLVSDLTSSVGAGTSLSLGTGAAGTFYPAINPPITGGDDITPPVYETNFPATNSVTTNSITTNHQLDEPGMAYSVAVDTTDDPAPTNEQVKAGQNNGGTAALASDSVSVVAATTTYTTSLTGITAVLSIDGQSVTDTTFGGSFTLTTSGAEYDTYHVAEDDEGTPNLQLSATKIDNVLLTADTITSCTLDGENMDINAGTGPTPSLTTPANLNAPYTKDHNALQLGSRPAHTLSASGVVGSDTTTLHITASGTDEEVIENAAGEQTGLWAETTNTAVALDQLEITDNVTNGSGGTETVALESDGNYTISNVVTPAVFTVDPASSATTGTSITISATTDKDTIWYGVAVPTGTKGPGTAPTAASNVRSGLAPDGTAATATDNIATTAAASKTLQFTGLSDGTTYDIYTTLALGNTLQFPAREWDESGTGWQASGTVTTNVATTDSYNNNLLSLTTTSSDTTPPTFENSTPTLLSAGTGSFSIEVQLNESGIVYGVACTDGQTAPTPEQVVAGTAPGQIDSDSTIVAASTPGTISFEGLAPETTYDLHFVAKDDEPDLNLQTEITSLLNQDTVSLPGPEDTGSSGAVRIMTGVGRLGRK